MSETKSRTPSPPRSARRSKSSPASIWRAGLRRAVRKAAQVARPPPELTVSQWADRNLRLSPEDSGEHGQYQSTRAPYQAGIMDACSDPTIESVVFMSSAQVGKTTILKAVIGYYIDQDPSIILVIYPTLELAEAFSKDRLAPMIRDTPCLRDKVADPKARDSGNTLLHKNFPAGRITIVGANSPAGLAARPIRVVLVDEASRCARSAGTEGDPIALGFKRTRTFWNRKKVMCSTPTIRGECRIEAAYQATDQRRYFVPCPQCYEYQILEWRNVSWPKGKPAEAIYKCPHCGHEISDQEKQLMLHSGEWRPTAEGPEGAAGFHLNELYSPWSTCGEIASGLVEAKKGGRETLQTWVNTSLGETWEEDQGERPDWASLQARAEPYHVLTVPAGGLFLTAGVDVQDDRLAVVIVAWGRGEESWRVYWGELYGDPSQPGGVWAQLDDLLTRGYEHESGALLHVTGAAVDSGHHTHHVYNYCRSRAPRVVAVKGMGQLGRPIITRPSAQDVQYKGTIIKNGVMLWPVGTDGAKRQIYHRLKITEPGPGCMHFPIGLPEEYYEQLTAEKLVPRAKHGVPYTEWIQLRTRNEAIDCEVYAYAAAIRAGMGRLDWGRLEQGLALRAGTDAPAPTVAPPVMAQPSGRRVRSRGI
jgi:phage terminase large subunit GpA-like protein